MHRKEQINTRMKIRDFVTEAGKDFKSKDFFNDKEDALNKMILARGKQMATYIKKNCQPWLKRTHNGKEIVYRGFKSEPGNKMAFTKPIRPNRKPKDSSMAEHIGMDFLIKLGGKVANRSNSMFVSGGEGTAEEYGVVYVVMPIGPFNYTWHEEHDDWVNLKVGHYVRLKDIEGDQSLSDEEKEKQWEAAKQKYDNHHGQKYISALSKIIASEYGGTSKDVYNVLMHISDYEKLSGPLWPGSKSNRFPYRKDKDQYSKPFYAIFSSWNDTIPSKKFWTAARKAVAEYIKKASTSELDKLYNKSSAVLKLWETHEFHYKPSQADITKSYKKGLKVLAHEYYYVANPYIFKSADDFLTYQKLRAQKKENAKASIVKFDPKKFTPENVDMEYYKETFGNELRGDDGTLIRAINNYNEIMIKAAHILAIHPIFYEDVVLPILSGRKPILNRKMQMFSVGDSDTW